MELHGEEIVKYRDMRDLKEKLIEVFEGKFDLNKVKRFLEERDAEVIASKFIELFKELVSVRNERS